MLQTLYQNTQVQLNHKATCCTAHTAVPAATPSPTCAQAYAVDGSQLANLLVPHPAAAGSQQVEAHHRALQLLKHCQDRWLRHAAAAACTRSSAAAAAAGVVAVSVSRGLTCCNVTLQQLPYRRRAVQHSDRLSVAVPELHQRHHQVPREAGCVAANGW